MKRSRLILGIGRDPSTVLPRRERHEHVTLASIRLTDPPKINHDFFDQPRNLDVRVGGLEIGRSLLGAVPLPF